MMHLKEQVPIPSASSSLRPTTTSWPSQTTVGASCTLASSLSATHQHYHYHLRFSIAPRLFVANATPIFSHAASKPTPALNHRPEHLGCFFCKARSSWGPLAAVKACCCNELNELRTRRRSAKESERSVQDKPAEHAPRQTIKHV